MRPSGALQADAALEEPPFAPAQVEEVLRLLTKAIRAHQLYLPNNPVYKTSIDAVRGALTQLWEQTDELALRFTEGEVKWYGRPVLTESAKSADSLPWTFFKDGVREIQLTRGFEDEELGKFLAILQRVRVASPDDDDLLTLLWESDFANLRYRYVDPGADGGTPTALEDGAPAGEPPSPDTLRGTIQEQASHAQPGIVNMQDFDATLYFLDDKELDYLRQEVDREYNSDLRQRVLTCLFDICEAQRAPNVRAEIADLLEQLLLMLLAAGQWRAVGYLLKEVENLAHQMPGGTPEQLDRYARIPRALSSAEPLGQLLQSLDESAVVPTEAELSELFTQLQPAALETIFTWLPRLKSDRVRAVVERAAGRLAGANIPVLVSLILSTNHTVAAEAIRRAAALRAPGAIGPLGSLLGASDASLRMLAVQALTDIGTIGAMQALEKAIADSERDVRVAAIRTLGSKTYRNVLGRLESIVQGKEIRRADLTEKMAFYEAYGAICGDAGIPFLDELLNKKGFFGKREDPELRACAAVALGRIGGAKAMEALQRSASEKDIVVRNAISRAMKGGAP